jgi:branched-chain amino acid transport system ATP-binding protein
MARPLLRLRGVEARYGRFVALQDVSLLVPEGAAVALLGPNGAGKTTLLRTVSGMLPPFRGEITFDGERIDGRRDHQIAALGLTHIPEGRGIFPGLTVRENLQMAAAASRVKSPDRAYEFFPILAERRDQVAGTLSGGEQQMLSISRAVIATPRLLMLDELSLGLAPKLVGALFQAVARIRDDGASVLLVEQYVTHALRLADIVVILHKGRVAFVGEPGEVRRDETLVESYLGHAGTASYAISEGEGEDEAAPRVRAGATRKKAASRKAAPRRRSAGG